MITLTPHAIMPLALNQLTGRFPVCDQDSAQDVGSCVLNILSCPQGANPYDPSFGYEPYTFAAVTSPDRPAETSTLISGLQAQEPRLADVEVQAAYSIVDQALTLAVQGEVGTS